MTTEKYVAGADETPRLTLIYRQGIEALYQEAVALEGDLAEMRRERDELRLRFSDTSTFELKARTAETLDAERYRYLRNAAGLGDDNDGPSICSGLSDLFEYHFGPECDEVVDAAMDRWKAAGCPLPKEAP